MDSRTVSTAVGRALPPGSADCTVVSPAARATQHQDAAVALVAPIEQLGAGQWCPRWRLCRRSRTPSCAYIRGRGHPPVAGRCAATHRRGIGAWRSERAAHPMRTNTSGCRRCLLGALDDARARMVLAAVALPHTASVRFSDSPDRQAPSCRLACAVLRRCVRPERGTTVSASAVPKRAARPAPPCTQRRVRCPPRDHRSPIAPHPGS